MNKRYKVCVSIFDTISYYYLLLYRLFQIWVHTIQNSTTTSYIYTTIIEPRPPLFDYLLLYSKILDINVCCLIQWIYKNCYMIFAPKCDMSVSI